MTRSTLVSAFSALVAFAFLTACDSGAGYPDNPDVVATQPNQAFPFSTATTYALPADVVDITDPNATSSHIVNGLVVNNQEDDSHFAIDASTETVILNQIDQNMTARGYTKATDIAGAKPDIFVQASVMSSTSTTVYYDYWYSYWGTYYSPWYGDMYSSGWAPYAVPYVTSSTVGSLIIEMTDPNHPNVDQKKIPSIWVGVVSGVITTSSIPEVQSRLKTSIDQAFVQSPYIERAP